ncbi:MAG: pentapeptide repeat-containing protein [Microcoleus sp.]
MPDASPCKKKKKLTIVASKQGIETAERALIRLGFDSKSKFAVVHLSRTTVTKFFNQVPIQLDSFQKICDALKLKWEEIAGITQESIINHEPIEIQVNARPNIEEGVQQKMLSRQVTVIDKHSQGIKAVITLQGDISLISDPQIFEAILKKYGGDSIHITNIQKGSIKLIIEGSQKDIARLLIQIKSGEITELDGFPVEDAQILSQSPKFDELLEKITRLLIQIKSEELTEIDWFPGESSEQKWRLVEEIVTNRNSRRNLSGADLSDADLRTACLIDANLSDSDLSDTDMRDANLRGADLRGADLSGTNLSGTNLSRANLSPAYLSHGDLKSPHLKRAKLSFADAIGTHLKGTYLKGADLKGADLKDADLRFADLSSTDMRDADLSGADLRGADLRGADLKGIQVNKTRFSDNLGITEKLKQHLIKRGAIFDDSPGDSLSPRIKWMRVRQKNEIFGKDSPSHN